ncbi:N5-carboxyaminoimidazole ribonucleotide mutase [Arsenophonus endosymbiont of Bemisia tabaci Q2]|nr:N5-carboxyaminoimidazole ribonucleotide mutase [Arsenophonus endosymbiont of Bemisia tabaci Q2]
MPVLVEPAHLPGMLAAKTLVPVFGVPLVTATFNGIDSLYSIVQMPKGIPVATFAIGKAGAANAALLAAQFLSGTDNELYERLSIWRLKQTNDLLSNPDPREVE